MSDRNLIEQRGYRDGYAAGWLDGREDLAQRDKVLALLAAQPERIESAPPAPGPNDPSFTPPLGGPAESLLLRSPLPSAERPQPEPNSLSVQKRHHIQIYGTLDGFKPKRVEAPREPPPFTPEQVIKAAEWIGSTHGGSIARMLRELARLLAERREG